MDPIFLNGIFFCTLNFILFFAGTFFNIVVVLSIWKSTQLRKKVCYFTIFLLSCSDLVVVMLMHPMSIYWYMTWNVGDISQNSPRFLWFFNIGSTTTAFSLLALLTMTLERYLGLAYPLFHKTSVTKKRLAVFLFTIQAFPFIFGAMNIIFDVTSLDKAYMPVFYGALLISLAVLNYRIFSIAKSRQKAMLSNGRKGIMEYKKHYTCVLAVISFVISCSLIAIYSALTLSHFLDASSMFAMCLFFWAGTAVSMNSTINSLIFFWLNKVLRSEGQKLLKRCGFTRS